ncbi:MAG: hypothetical protein A4E74_01792 [Syntrophus sp. PtaB.Bin075]|nr:MAG: hypothetical protein A4E74_01792 [Syntrophus sp. PtaB.Bin075]
MDIDFFRGEPFHAVGEAEGPVRRQQGAQGRAHARVGERCGGQARVVVGFGEMDRDPFTGRHLDRFGKIPLDLIALIILKQLGVRPVEIALAEQFSRNRNFPTQTLQEKDGVGKLLPHLGDDVPPGRYGNHVARVATEAVHPSAAPCQKDIRHVSPHVLMAVIQAGQVLPDHSPGAGGFNFPLLVAGKPLGMAFMQAGRPAGVIDRDIDDHFAVAGVDPVHQFQKLLHGRG